MCVVSFECILFDDMISFFEKQGSDMYARLRKSNDYKTLLDTLYKKPMKYYDKPVYEIKKEMKITFQFSFRQRVHSKRCAADTGYLQRSRDDAQNDQREQHRHHRHLGAAG